ncbi:MAG: glucuronate isomerase [Bacteroidota bacterium]
MKAFLDDNFLLSNRTAEKLYHDIAEELPIIDYHNHLSPGDIANDRQFENLTKAWLEDDHYKWRAMRANGIAEEYITGSCSDNKKFNKWAETVPYTLRNPLYHWTHLELKRYFGIEQLLNSNTAESIYLKAGEMLQDHVYSCRNLLRSKRVELLCTTDDPTDDLHYHQAIAKSDCEIHVLPTFRPDKAINLQSTDYIQELSDVTNTQIDTVDDLLAALRLRINYFHENGCRLADISFEQLPTLTSAVNASNTFLKWIKGKNIDVKDAENLQAFLLFEVCKIYHELGWTQQFHLGVVRNTNTLAFQLLGPDTGFDTISDASQGQSLLSFLDHLESTDQLAKTILYNLNPRDNYLFATAVGNFQKDVPGKIQYGAAWWYLDQKDGIRDHLDILSNIGLLSRFIGMLTDSRSFLSFSRHEYFRRILCDLIGRDVENGELPSDQMVLQKLITDICYQNTKDYFNF